ncbi:alpha/beta fold hydrolase [Streptomyces sp. NPDC047042]|uniref:alpha/beta hydrolase n=1 Tax=Streptomyces sp. NPDC047042 TaxID=3154807 RepID=UPI0033D7B9C9
MSAITEVAVDVMNGDVVVPAIMTVPARPSAVVILLHGTMSQKNEVAGVYRRLAAALARRGIGSLRIDFRGCGDSVRPQPELTVETQVSDARAAVDHVTRDPAFSDCAVGVLGFSQGGRIAALLAARDSRVKGLVTWNSGAFDMTELAFYKELHAEAEAAGTAWLRAPWGGTFELSAQWFAETASVRPEAEIGAYEGPILTVNCADDELVDPEAGKRLVLASSSGDASAVLLRAGGHIFGLDEGDGGGPLATRLVDDTCDWFASRLRDEM